MRIRLPLTTLLNALALPALCVVGGVWFLVDPHDETVSEVENRALATFPEFSWERLARGHYTRDLDQYVADHFPLRERFVSVAFWVKAHRGPQRDSAVYDAPSLDKGGLERVEDWIEDDVDGGPDDVVDAGAEADDQTTDAGPSDGPFAPDNVKVKDGVFVADGRAVMLFTGKAEHGRQYADVVNAYAEALSEQGVQVHNVVTPTATTFYMPDAALSRTRSERAHIDAINAQLAENVKNADVYAELAPHAERAPGQVGDEVFYKTDHHWTGLGAYYGYRAWAKAAGVTPVRLDELEKKTKSGYSGSLYRMTQDRALLKSIKDDVTDYWLPAVTYTATAYKTTDLKTVVPARFLDEREHGYLVFLGWDHPLMIAKVDKTDVDNGRRAVLVKNSYGNAFAPWLLHHFEQVVVVDYRYYSGSIMSLVKKHGITDVILVGAVSTTGSRPHHRRLKAVLKGSGTVWDPVPPRSEEKPQEPPK